MSTVPTTADPSVSPEASDRPSIVRTASAPVLLLLATALVATVMTATYTGAAAAQLLADSGPLIRWGIPLLKALGDLAAALTIGGAVLTATALPAGIQNGHRTPSALRGAMTMVGVAASVWGLTTAVLAGFSYADAVGIPLSSPEFGAELGSFLWNVSAGQGYLFTLIVAVVTSFIAVAGTTITAAAWAALIAMMGLVPAALLGHSAGSANHETAVTALGLHLVGVSVWVGGLVTLLATWAILATAQRAVVVRRYSPLALWSAVAVAFGGVVSAWLRLTGIGDLVQTRYGVVVLIKSVLFALLIVAGWQQRRRVIVMLDSGADGAFRRLAVTEVALMGAAVGLAAALARSAPPVAREPQPNITLTESVTGYPLPPPPDLNRWLFSWQPDLLWLLIGALAGAGYLTGMIRLRRRGDRWPVWRAVLWTVGVAVLVWVTCGGPTVYGRVQFSAHMSGHMILGMMVPFLLVLAAPITLAMRALPARGDGSRGPREWLLAAIESRFSRLISTPIAAGLLFTGSLFIFYFSPLFDLALRTHVGHELMHAHFLAAGFLFMWVLIGVDPGPRRPSYPLRLVFMLVVVAFHAFFGITLMQSTYVLAEPYFTAVGRTWALPLLADQRFGGGIAWGAGELPIVLVGLILSIQWARSDQRAARRSDRQADRDGDAELNAYNEMLARVAKTDERRQD